MRSAHKRAPWKTECWALSPAQYHKAVPDVSAATERNNPDAVPGENRFYEGKALLGIAALILMASGPSHCTYKYLDNDKATSGAVLRRGGPPMGTGQRIPPNDTAASSGSRLEAAAPNGPENWRIDPDAPKQSNGAFGSVPKARLCCCPLIRAAGPCSSNADKVSPIPWEAGPEQDFSLLPSRGQHHRWAVGVALTLAASAFYNLSMQSGGFPDPIQTSKNSIPSLRSAPGVT
jgi:hypothetical protein